MKQKEALQFMHDNLGCTVKGYVVGVWGLKHEFEFKMVETETILDEEDHPDIKEPHSGIILLGRDKANFSEDKFTPCLGLWRSFLEIDSFQEVKEEKNLDDHFEVLEGALASDAKESLRAIRDHIKSL